MKEKNLLLALRHTAEHILMQAMEELWPGKIIKAMGPPTDEGFYFDFETRGIKISEDDFPKIEKKMRQIVQQDLPLVKKEISIKEARKLFADNPYKQEWLDEIEARGEKATVYYTGLKDTSGVARKDSLGVKGYAFVDLCAGPHVKSTGEVKAFKLLKVAGAYWRGDEKNKMLTRIYGTAFPTQKELDDYLARLEEAKKRDHRRIGRELDLFSFHPQAPGDVFWHANGYIIFREMVSYWRQLHQREGYLEVRTPEIMTRSIWDQSGHTRYYLDKIYRVIPPDAKEWNMAVKPMNCNGGILIYKTRQWSYRDFPLRMGELGVVHRYESSGETLGILRPREFTQDDAHIFCTPGQVKEELKRIINLCFEVYQTFGVELDHLELSTRPEKSIGSDEIWERAETIMRQILEEGTVDYRINEGEGAFYGPKFDFHLRDSLGRTWQCATIQLDFALPEKFDLSYVTEQGTRERPVMIHRVLYGSIERFLGILIENYAGAFPVWLAPVQAVVLPITEKQNQYAQKVAEQLSQIRVADRATGARIKVDDSHQTLSYRIRHWELQKVPYILVVGDREAKSKTVNVRKRGEEKQQEMELTQFAAYLEEKIRSRSLKV